MDLYRLFTACLTVSYEKTGVAANYKALRDKDILYLFFEDSDGKTDWKNNLDFPAKAYKRMGKTIWFAHRGFLKVWKEIEPKLAEIIADPQVKRIVSAGYSHGGALAFLCHEYIWYHREDLRQKIEGYGFGAPRVFFGRKTKALKKRWERFTVIRNLNDLITHLPPAFLGYSHMGTLLTVGKRGKYSSIEAHYADNIAAELKEYENERKKNAVQPVPARR